MDINSWLKQAQDVGAGAWSSATSALGTGAGYVQSTLSGVTWFGSTESSLRYDDGPVDEKHYFLVPDRRNDAGYSLYVLRCLPEGVPPINDLPKRRLVHLPSKHAMPALEQLVLNEAREEAKAESTNSPAIGARLNDLADQIDKIDGKVFNGVLLIGGLVALINPLAGAAIAVKAMVPSIGLLLSRYGLQYAGDTADSYALSSRVKAAEKEVLCQFHDSETTSIENPILQQLDKALRTTEHEYDPLMEFDQTHLLFGDQDRDRLLKLTCQAVSNTYDGVLRSKSKQRAASMGPEDVRYLKMLEQIATGKLSGDV